MNIQTIIQMTKIEIVYKVRPFIDLMRKHFREVYSPGKNLSVDESLVLYKGCLHFKQFIRTKTARFGIKLYKLCTDNGITLDVLVYCGKGMFGDDDLNSDMPSTERIPSVLTEPFLGKGHVLFTDNDYTSPTLAKHFTDNSTHLCETIRANRYNYSKHKINEVLEKGDAVFYLNTDDPMMACKYRSAKDKASGQQEVVYMLPTCHEPIMVDIANRREGEPVVQNLML